MARNKFNVAIPEHVVLKHQEHERRATLKKWEYCKTDDLGVVEEVYCKCCGCCIMGPRDWGDPEVRRAKDDKNTVVVTQRVRIMPFNNYSMVLLKMSDGSHHLTPVCDKCATEVANASADHLDDIYTSDLNSLADTAAHDRDMEVVEKMHKRKPVGVL